MRWIVPSVLLGLAACGVPAQTVVEENTTTYTQPVHETNVVNQKAGYSDPDGSLGVWKATVLDRADAETLARLRGELQARLDRDVARDKELTYHAPGLVVEARIDMVNRIAYDKACLQLIDAQLGR